MGRDMMGKDRAPESQVPPGEHGNAWPPATGTASTAPNSQQQSSQQQGPQQPPGSQQPRADQAATPRERGWRTPGKPGGTQDAGWAITSYLIGGMLFYGGLGWLIARWTGHQGILVPVGLLAGLAVGLVLVVLRYGRA